MCANTPSYISVGFRGKYSLSIIKITIQTILENRAEQIFKLSPISVK